MIITPHLTIGLSIQPLGIIGSGRAAPPRRDLPTPRGAAGVAWMRFLPVTLALGVVVTAASQRDDERRLQTTGDDSGGDDAPFDDFGGDEAGGDEAGGDDAGGDDAGGDDWGGDGGDDYEELAKLVASDAGWADYFGGSVSISGDVMVVGAHYDDDGGSASGSAYVFATTDGGATWSETAKLVASDAAMLDHFGTSVAISGNVVVVGAHQDDDADIYSGSAYTFTLPSPTVAPSSASPSALPTSTPTFACRYSRGTLYNENCFAAAAILNEYIGESFLSCDYLFSCASATGDNCYLKYINSDFCSSGDIDILNAVF